MKVTPIASKISFNSKGKIPPDIFLFKNVDKNLYRGAKPTESQLYALKDFGINSIIDFTIHKIGTNKKTEKQIAEILNIDYHNIGVASGEVPQKKDIISFFNIINKIKELDKTAYVHCNEGKVRTGLFVSMYKLKYKIADLASCIEEMLKIGRHNEGNDDAIMFLREFYKELSGKDKFI